jgi:GTP-binding protein EngB required for normal cell division
LGGNKVGISHRNAHDPALARFRLILPLFGYVAADHQHGNDGVTFLVVFLIQNTQNRDARAIHLKLDEIIKSIDQAQNEMIDIEHLSDVELQSLAEKYQKVREECDVRSQRRKADSTRH